MAVLRVLLRELSTRERAMRVPEPELVMDDPEKVAAYTAAGREAGVMAPVYLFHSAQICDVVTPGDTVLDLGCGPATQLAQVARLNPGVKFIGIDLSAPMLERAREHVRAEHLDNVEFRLCSITELKDFGDSSVDAVVSMLALHHLPGTEQLRQVFNEVARVLRPDGGVYISDFGHLRSETSMQYFAYQYAHRQPELFTLDYLYSLRAAFAVEDIGRAAGVLAGRIRLHTTFLAPYMVALKSKRRRDGPGPQRQLAQLKAALPANHQIDLRDLKTFFSLGGLRSPSMP